MRLVALALLLSIAAGASTAVAQSAAVPAEYRSWVVGVLDRIGALEIDCPPVTADATIVIVCAQVDSSPSLFRRQWDLYAPDEAERRGLTLETYAAWRANGSAFTKFYRRGRDVIAVVYSPINAFSGYMSILLPVASSSAPARPAPAAAAPPERAAPPAPPRFLNASYPYFSLTEFALLFGATLDTNNGNPRLIFLGTAHTFVPNATQTFSTAGEARLDAPALIRDGQTLVPARFLTSAFGCSVQIAPGDDRLLLVVCPATPGAAPALPSREITRY